MDDKPDSNKNALTLYRNRSLAIKRSGLVKRGLELLHEPKKRQVRVVIGDGNQQFITLYSGMIETLLEDRYDLKVRSSFYCEELLEIAENGSVDIFIFTLNNIYF